MKQASEGILRSYMENNKAQNRKIENLAKDKDGNIQEETKKLIQSALAASDQGEAIRSVEETNLNIASIRAKAVKSNNDLENFIKNEKIQNVGSDFNKIDDKQTARNYLKYVLGYTDEDLSHISIDDNWGNTSVKWTSNYTDSQGNTHETDSYIYKELNDEEARSTIAYQLKAKQITDKMENLTDTLLEDTTNAITEMMRSTTSASSQYGVDFSNIILNSMAGRKDLQNADLDFSEVFDELTDAEIKGLVGLDSNQLAEALGLSENTLINLGYESAEAFEKAFDEGILAKRQALIQTLTETFSLVSTQAGTTLSDNQLGNIATSMNNKLSTEQMQALSNNSLSLKQIDYSQDVEKVSEQLDFMSKQMLKAKSEGISLSSSQKELTKNLNTTEGAVKAFAEELQNSNDYLEDNDGAAVDVALANARMNKGIDTLADNWKT